MISPDSVVIGMRPLASCYSAIGLMTSNLALEIGTNPSWTVIFENVSKLRVTMLEATFFCSDLKSEPQYLSGLRFCPSGRSTC